VLQGIKRFNMAGRDLTLHLAKLLKGKGHNFTTTGKLSVFQIFLI